MPEIELPGHSNELPAAYPELTCKGKWTFDATDVCIGRESTFRFFEDILGEVLELFPSYYIHIGGDEAAMNHWGSCPDCRARMKQEGLKDEHEPTQRQGPPDHRLGRDPDGWPRPQRCRDELAR